MWLYEPSWGRWITVGCLSLVVPFQQSGPSCEALFAMRYICLNCTFFSLHVSQSAIYCSERITSVACDFSQPFPSCFVSHAHVDVGVAQCNVFFKAVRVCSRCNTTFLQIDMSFIKTLSYTKNEIWWMKVLWWITLFLVINHLICSYFESLIHVCFLAISL